MRRGGKRATASLSFPRYQQLDCVRKLVERRTGARNGAALPDSTLSGKRQDLHHRMACPPTVHPSRCG